MTAELAAKGHSGETVNGYNSHGSWQVFKQDPKLAFSQLEGY